MLGMEVLRELDRPRARSGATAVWRRSTVTAVQASPKRVQTALTGEAWIRYPAWWTPAVGAEVELLQQGADAIVVTVLA
jgi:hypothetical protein